LVVGHLRFIAALSLLELASCVATLPPPAPLVTPAQTRLHDDLAYLASPALTGRLSGTPGNDSAAAFIARRYAELGVTGVFKGGSCECEPSFFQLFRLAPFSTANLDIAIQNRTRNVGAVVNGTDSVLRHEYVVVGAHYDHLGRSNTYSRDIGLFAGIHPGADDNASGTAAVLELARRFADKPARRSVIFANFSAEELGLVGSYAFLEHSPVPQSAIITMVNLDMVGRLRENRMILFSGEDDDRFHAVVDSVEHIPPAIEFRLRWLSATRALSDHASFAYAHIPVLGLFTDYHEDYHRRGDIVDRINFQGLETIVDFTERFVRAIADGNDRPNWPGHRD
jgi:hypothetical protein